MEERGGAEKRGERGVEEEVGRRREGVERRGGEGRRRSGERFGRWGGRTKDGRWRSREWTWRRRTTHDTRGQTARTESTSLLLYTPLDREQTLGWVLHSPAALLRAARHTPSAQTHCTRYAQWEGMGITCDAAAAGCCRGERWAEWYTARAWDPHAHEGAAEH